MKKKTILITIGIIIAAALLTVGGIAIYKKVHYNDKWYNGTKINGLDVSGLTLEESKNKLKSVYENYKIKIKGREDAIVELKGTDIKYVMDPKNAWDDLFKAQHDTFSLFRTDGDKTVKYDVSYKEGKLKKILNKSMLIAGSDTYKIVAPEDAYVDFDKEKNQFVCINEVYGNTLNKKKFYEKIDEALSQTRQEINLDDKKIDVYESPKAFATDKLIKKNINASNKAAVRFVSWNMGDGHKEWVTPSDISKWIRFTDGKIQYDDQAISDWVEKLCLKYKTVGSTRRIKSHTGKYITVKGGDYGWQIDFKKMLAQVKDSLNQKLDADIIESYINDPSEENKKAVTFKKKVAYLNEGFKRDYDNLKEDWDTQNYTEVSIADQMVYVIRNGKVSFSCRCITGKPVPKRTTPRGAFFVKEHRDEYTLRGADYETHVKNWVRITWSGTGFHPATWQPWSRWNSNLYKSIGSHGCVNLHPSDAQKIYDTVKYRELVIIH